MDSKRIAVVTGASSGIGAAAAVALHNAGFQLVLGARRLDKLQEVGDPLGALCLPLDVTDAESVAAFCSRIPQATGAATGACDGAEIGANTGGGVVSRMMVCGCSTGGGAGCGATTTGAGAGACFGSGGGGGGATTAATKWFTLTVTL